jgi:hypothetical protein
MAEQGTHKPLVGSSNLPLATHQEHRSRRGIDISSASRTSFGSRFLWPGDCRYTAGHPAGCVTNLLTLID